MADARKVSTAKASSQQRHRGQDATKERQPPLAWLFYPKDDDSLVGTSQPKSERTFIKNERKVVLKYLRKRARKMPSEDAPEELILLIDSFLNSHGFPSASRVLSLERTAREHATDSPEPGKGDQISGSSQVKHGLKEIYEAWRRGTTSKSRSSSGTTESRDEDSDNSSDMSDSGSSRPESSQGELRGQGSSTNSDNESSTSGSESESDDNSSLDSSASSAKIALTVKKVSVSPLSSTSNSEDDAARADSRNEEDPSSESSESESDSSSSSSRSESGDEQKPLSRRSGVEIPKLTTAIPKVATEKMRKGFKGRADYSDSSATLQAPTPTKQSATPASTSSSSNLDSSSDDRASETQLSKAPLSSLGKRKLGATGNSKVDEGAKRQKKGPNAPFQRIPSDTKIDPRLASNAYVPYDYAERAYQDLIVTKGKGFTKEKNKKKRGSYRGGTIDNTGGRSFKFED